MHRYVALCLLIVFWAVNAVVIVDNFAVLQTIHEQLRCVEFADSVAIDVCS